MNLRNTAAVLLVAIVLATVTPILAVVAACPEDEATDCCDLDGAACVCCSHGPRVALVEALAGPGDALRQLIGPEISVAPQEAFPRDILHVPRNTSVR